MESFRLLQQRALRQLLTTRRATIPHQSLRQLSQCAPRTSIQAQSCKFSTRPSNPFTHTPRYRPRKPQSPHQRRYQSTTTPENEANLSLSGRLRKLSREYGWSALGVYLLLSALDFPFCFLAVRTLGTDRIGRWEHIVLGYIKSVVPESVLEIEWPWGQREVEERVEGRGNADGKVDAVDSDMRGKVEMEVGRKRILEEKGEDYQHEPREAGEFLDHGVEQAEKANRGDNASLWTQLALAYAIHKSFIFLRVPLTAAVTPKVVKTLRGWGWNIGKRPQTGRLAKKPKTAKPDGTGVNTKGSGVKPE